MTSTPPNNPYNITPEPIAICGMACRLPGGVSSPSDFWQMLLAKRSGRCDNVPESRFNIDAYYHPDLERPGSFNVRGGYFLDGRPEDFDPTAFNITPVEAQWLDPQQRRMLEVTYECLESAGLPLHAVAGSNTAVFVGSFTSDYQQMSTREHDFRHNYAATGVDPGLISNRVGNIFDLKGPSFTINTACSSSIYAIHLACLALRARDCDAAITGGVNMILTVDQHMNTAKLGILSPTSTCHTFDAAADGYGRAEGVGALYLKRLSDAIRDRDLIRGVIRSTAINTNGKVEGFGITHPSGKGQERVIRMAYDKAGLDPIHTRYAELHGTGTPVGDPIEVQAVANAMNDARSGDDPLIVGAVKPNIGHSEAASGIFAVMKAAMMTEAAVVPGIAHFETLNPAIHPAELNIMVNAETTRWPDGSPIRRASVSSFGYGGTNGHVIVESVETLCPQYTHASAKKDATDDRSSDRPVLLCFSAHDKPTLARNITAFSKVAADYYLADLAYTLNMNRSRWAHRAFAIACEGHIEESIETPPSQTGIAFATTPEIGFLFTGQGAQWLGMGRAVAEAFPSFLHTIQKLDDILARLEPCPQVQLRTMIFDNVDIYDPSISQVYCTAIQLALVDLLAQWDINPSVTVGHSSGEIVAAYAAGLISAPEAILSAFCRGISVKNHSRPGTMLAAGMGEEEAQKWLSPYTEEQLCIACVNSPDSVTLSGLPEYISRILEELTARGVFSRELKTGTAYHSPHMAAVVPAYDKMLSDALSTLSADDLTWRRPQTAAMVSSVTGQPVDADISTLPASYWTQNLRSQVKFNTAIQALGCDSRFNKVKMFVEIGPHSTLSGPFKQICAENGFDYTYVASMSRNQSDIDQLLSVAGNLFLVDYPLDLDMVNTIDSALSLDRDKSRCHRLLPDLPPYQWNYETTHWAEPRGSSEQRRQMHPRHDLLGRQITGLTSQSRVWRNVLRPRDIPWLKDHTLGGEIIFPAAGYLSLAIEGLRQMCEIEGLLFEGVRLRDIDLNAALVLPDTDAGVEIQVRLEALLPEEPGTCNTWYSFYVESISETQCVSHCRGRVSPLRDGLGGQPDIVTSPSVEQNMPMQPVPGRRWYDAFRRVGFQYGPTFQLLQQVQKSHESRNIIGVLKVQEGSQIMKNESRYIIHPSTIDTCLQLIIISIHGGNYKEMPWGVVPVQIGEAVIRFPEGDEGHNGTAVAWTDGFHGRQFNSTTVLKGKSGNLLATICDLRSVAYEVAVPTQSSRMPQHLGPYSMESWKPDILTLGMIRSPDVLPRISSEEELIGDILQLINHKRPVKTALLCGDISEGTIDSVLSVLPPDSLLVLNSCGGAQQSGEKETRHGLRIIDMPTSLQELNEVVGVPCDIAIIDGHVPLGFDAMKTTVKDDGWLVYAVSETHSDMDEIKAEATPGFMTEVRFWDPMGGSRCLKVVSLDPIFLQNLRQEKFNIDIIRLESQPENRPLASHLEKIGCTIRNQSLDVFHQNQLAQAILIDDTTGSLLESMDSKSFESLKTLICSGLPILWLTKGVRQGTPSHGGMVPGFLRAIRSERAAARMVHLDVDHEQHVARISEAITLLLQDIPTKESGKDTEFWLHKGALHISRIVPNRSMNAEYSPSSLGLMQRKPLPQGVYLSSALVNGCLQFSPYGKPPSTLHHDSVEIQVSACELQAAQDSPILVTGTVLRCGSSVAAGLRGKQVAALVHQSFPTIVQTPIFVPLQPAMENPEGVIGDLSTLMRILNISTKMEKFGGRNRILVLPGPATIVHQLIPLGRALQWDMKLVASSSEEETSLITTFDFQTGNIIRSSDREAISEVLRSESDGLAIIAHDFSELSQHVWSHTPSHSLFILNETTISTSLDSKPLSRGALFVPTSIRHLDTTAASGLLKECVDLLGKHPQLARHSASVHDICQTDRLSELVQDPTVVHVFRYHYNDSLVNIKPSQRFLALEPKGCYLLVGCLGGLGRSVAKFMFTRGARHFVFISRSGAKKAEAAQLIGQLEAAGASVCVFRADVTSESAMTRIVKEVNSRQPIRGVISAAMVLSDGVFEQMSHESFFRAVTPKVQGSLALSSALQHIDLDFFVLTSSVSAALGNPGQSNYSAGNSFLDSLALQQRLSGCPAISLVLPMVLDVGTVAETAGLEASLRRKGMYGIGELEMLQSFEATMLCAMGRRQAKCDDTGGSQILLGLEAAELVDTIDAQDSLDDAYWYNDARLRNIRSMAEDINGGTSSSSSQSRSAGGISEMLQQDPTTLPDDMDVLVAKYVANRVASILLISPESIDLDGPSVASYGLDSMVGAELRNWLFKEFGLEYSFQQLLSPSLTFIGLADAILSFLGARK